jgi:hypothetical protein
MTDYQSYKNKITQLERLIVYLWIGVFLLGSSFLGFSVYTYESTLSERTITEKIEAFKTDAKEELAVVIAERAVFVKEKSWKGRLTLSDTEEVSYYDEEIKELECLNQAINLLEVRLTYP